jgi:hypothetical protein
MKHAVSFTLAALLTAVLGSITPTEGTETRAVKPTSLAGIVTSTAGVEAGVWVIAETTDLGQRFTKIVVTDDRGRYVLPDLPPAGYNVFVRGYQLVDSPGVHASPGTHLDLQATRAPDARTAANYYPAAYWWALIELPPESDFPGTGLSGNGISPALKSQQHWLSNMHECLQCHQIGDLITRTWGANTAESWMQRVTKMRGPGDASMGDQAKGYTQTMSNTLTHFGRERGAKMLADWAEKIKGGALPEVPRRPIGLERNIVLTLREWGKDGSYFHDEVSSDRRNPTVNANGPIYGALTNLGKLGIFDPVTSRYSEVEVPGGVHGYVHTVMLDQRGRVWMPNAGPLQQPDAKPVPRADFCSNGALSKFAKYWPIRGSYAFVHMYDPATKTVTSIPSCSGGAHLWFDQDNNLYGALWGLGWLDTKVWDETKDPAKANGWCPLVLDTKEQGRIDRAAPRDQHSVDPDSRNWNQLNAVQDPKKDTLIKQFVYGLGVSPVDGVVWGGVPDYPGGIVRMDRGTNPPETCHTEYYEPPKLSNNRYAAFAPHDTNVDSKGMVWVSFTSGQIGRFDRSQCKVLRGPTAIGPHCPEGWKIYNAPGPVIKGTGVPAESADHIYQTFVDRFNTLGLGKDVSVYPGSNSDSLLAFIPEREEWVRMVVPYPMGFFARWVDGRIDDPNGGWKGRGLWSTFATVPTWHQELTGSGNSSLVKFQIRPNPLAD